MRHYKTLNLTPLHKVPQIKFINGAIQRRSQSLVIARALKLIKWRRSQIDFHQLKGLLI